MAAENEVPKQRFLLKNHNVRLLIPDVMGFKQVRVSDVRTPNESVYLPHSSVKGGGFSCKDKSRANNARKAKASAVRKGQGTSGETFEGIASYIIKVRPQISFLENVPETESKDYFNEDTLEWESDAEYIKQKFEAHDFFVMTVVLFAEERGSAKRRDRWWAVILDLLPEVATVFSAHLAP